MRRRLAVAAIVLAVLVLLVAVVGVVGWVASAPAPPAEASSRTVAAGEPRPRATRPGGTPGWRDARCEVPGGREGAEVVAVAVETREAQTALVEDGGFVLVVSPEARTLLVDVPGLETVHVEVDPGGACQVLNRPEKVVELAISVRFRSGRVPTDARIDGCGLSQAYWSPADPVERVRISEPCVLEAWYSAAVAEVSEPVRVDPRQGDQDVELVLPWENPAGMMLQIEKRGALFVVTGVSSEAAEVLAVGDRIVAIEGQAAAELTTSDFVRLDAGPPDTTVALTVLDDEDDEREVHVPRER